MNRPAVTTLVALVFALVASACTGGAGTACEPLPSVRPGFCLDPVEVREAAPADTAPLLAFDGPELGPDVGVGDFEGQVVVINFWASWCAPCRTEQPDLNVAHQTLAGDDVVFLGANIQDTVPNAQGHLAEFDVPYPSLFDPANIYASKYRGVGPRAIPSTIIIDREGRVAARLFGSTTAGELQTLVNELLAE